MYSGMTIWDYKNGNFVYWKLPLTNWDAWMGVFANSKFAICLISMPHLWSLISSFTKRVSNCTLLSSFCTLSYKLIIDSILYKSATSSTAALSLVKEQGKVGKFYCKVHISVSKNYERALSSKFQCHTLQVRLGCCFLDYLPNLNTNH